MICSSAGFDDLLLQHLEDISIDDILRALICESDLMEVVAILDFIVEEDGCELKMFKNGVQTYPAIEED